MSRILILVCFAVSTAFAKDCPFISNELSGLIKSHAHEIRGAEYCEYRSVYSSDRMELVLYSIEGACSKNEGKGGACGNMHIRYLVGIENGKRLPPLEVGKRGGFSASSMEIDKTTLKLKGFKYADNDPMCCPSITESKFVTITNTGFEFTPP